MKYKQKKGDLMGPQNENNSYNLKEHSVNIRVKYGRDLSKDNATSDDQNSQDL